MRFRLSRRGHQQILKLILAACCGLVTALLLGLGGSARAAQEDSPQQPTPARQPAPTPTPAEPAPAEPTPAAEPAEATSSAQPGASSIVAPPAPRLLPREPAVPINKKSPTVSQPGAVLIEDSSSLPPEQPLSAAEVGRSGPTRNASRASAGDSDASPAFKPVATPPAKPRAPVVKPKPAIEASRLKGIQPGTSTLAEVNTAWGMPVSAQRFGDRLEHDYKLDPFPRVTVVFHNNLVSAIIVDLQQPLPTDVTTRQLALEELVAVLVYGDSGDVLGQAFPERGVLFSYQPSQKTPLVAQIILEPIRPQSFVMRAEIRLKTDVQASLDDVEEALKLEPKFARALWLKAQLLASTGRNQEALPAADEAHRLDPQNAEYRLTRAKLLAQTGQTSTALSETKAAVAKPGLSPLVKARGLCQMADLVASGPAADYLKSVEHRRQAISLIEPLAASPQPGLAGEAKDVWIEAHLGIAHDIAWGPWNRKAAVSAKWLAEAEAAAADTDLGESMGRLQRFRVARQALSVLTGLQGELDPTPWVTTTQQLGREMHAATDDPLRDRQLDWQLGMAMYDALQIYHSRGQTQSALRSGAVAIDCLERAIAGQPDSPQHAYLLGRLYFRVGAVHAVLAHEHTEALAWYNKALPLLSDPAASATTNELGRQGESLVSMGVSFWEVGDKQKALQMTTQGLEWMEQSVREGLLPEATLGVPYANLATMHRRLGDQQAASRFESMASKSSAERK